MMSLSHFGTGKVYPQISQIAQILATLAPEEIGSLWFVGIQSARGLAQSKTLREVRETSSTRQRLGLRWPSTAFRP